MIKPRNKLHAAWRGYRKAFAKYEHGYRHPSGDNRPITPIKFQRKEKPCPDSGQGVCEEPYHANDRGQTH